MNSLTVLVAIFVAFGIYGAISERRAAAGRRVALERMSLARRHVALRVRNLRVVDAGGRTSRCVRVGPRAACAQRARAPSRAASWSHEDGSRP